MLRLWAFFLSQSLFLFAAGASDFQRKLKQQEKVNNDKFHSSILKQLADSRPGHVNISNNTVSHSILSFESSPSSSFATLATNSSISLQIYTSDSLPSNPSPSSACATALTATIPCNSSIPLMALGPFIFSNDLPVLCTDECLNGLKTYRADIVSACGSYLINDSNGNTYPPTLAVDYVSAPYTVQCLKDPGTGKFCGGIIESYNTTDGLLALPTNELCTFCTLETLNTTLSNPTSYSVDLADLLSSAIATCGANFDQYNVTSPGDQTVVSTPFGVNATTTSTVDCTLTGRNITASQATTCADVAAQNSVSEYDVFSSNPLLDADCNIDAGTVLCVPQQCTTYVIAVNDTCQSVAELAGTVPGTSLNVTASQIQSFNPDLGTYCQLISLRVGKAICLSPNGGWPSVAAGASAGNPSGTPTAAAPIPTPTVNGTTAACGRYYLVQDGDICQTVCLTNSITFSDFLILNPQVDANCTNLWLGYNYCVAPYPPFSAVTAAPIPTTNYTSATTFSYPIPTANYTITYTSSRVTAAGVPAPTNIANGTRSVACGSYYDIQIGDTLDSVSALVGVNASLLATWNVELSSGVLPAVGSAICVTFPEGNYTLIPASRPANVYTNATTECAQYYTVQNGDGCDSIESSFALTNSQFDQLNPGLASQCTNLIIGLAYCVLPTSPFSGTPSSTGPPDNVAPGTITDGCTSYYTVKSGDSCSVIESNFNITLTQIITWNPEINSQCTNIELGLAYCVASSTSPSSTGPPSNVAPGTITNGCTAYYTVVSGDSCPAIESKFNITFAQLTTWNPEINSQCTNIELGLAYCVTSTSSGSSGSSPPANLATGSLSNCTSYHTVVSGDNCPAIETSFKIAAADFFKWNPEVSHDCSNILVGEAYCVAGGGNPCTKLYVVQSGDFCFAITQSQNISQQRLNALNPFLDTNCDLVVGESLCIG